MNHERTTSGAGIGLKHAYVEPLLAAPRTIPWLEVHTENYMVAGGPRLEQLARIRERYDLAFHGVGASLGGPQLPQARHLDAVRRLVDAFEPMLVSEHAVWSRAAGVYYAELLPLPRTGEALARLCDGIDRYQEAIGRRILIENPANYLPFASEMDEPDFLVEAAMRTGAALLLDVNNVYVSARNCGIDAYTYIEALPPERVGEIHVAGFEVDENFGERLLIDSHAAPVSEPVWALLEFALKHIGRRPVLLERDGKLPAFETLIDEWRRAESILERPMRGEERSRA